jgi:hypothetical protein
MKTVTSAVVPLSALLASRITGIFMRVPSCARSMGLLLNLKTGRVLMKMRVSLAAAFTVTLAGSAYADFYVVENQSTHKCEVVAQQPMPGTIGTVVGDGGYRSLQEAEAVMRSALACSNTPIGSGSTTTTNGPADRAPPKCGGYLAPWPCRR